MSKGLEAFNELKGWLVGFGSYQKEIKTVEKELKALEIIKSKKVDCWAFILDIDNIDNIDYKETHFAFSSIDLTDEEIALLKEVLL